MKKYVLFVFGAFEDHEDIQFFCLEVFGKLLIVDSIKYIIENTKNIIIIFESNEDKTKLINEIHPLLENDNIMFYFLFDMDNMVGANIPESVRDFIFKPTKGIESIQIIYELNYKMNLDDILEKIKKEGINSLTLEERRFLDDFEK